MTEKNKQKQGNIFWCESCDGKYVKEEKADHCKRLNHTMYLAIPKIKKELKKEFAKLKRKSGTTIEEKEDAKQEINDLQEIAGFNITDWDDPENEIDTNNIKKIYDFAKTNLKSTVISKDSQNDVFAKIDVNGHIEPINLSTSRAQYWLMHTYRKYTNEFFSLENYKTVLKQLTADALFDNSNIDQTYLRISQKSDCIYYDLGRSDWEIIKIAKQGYLLIPYHQESPVFERPAGTVTQIMPNDVTKPDFDPLKKFCELFRIQNKTIFKVHLIHFFFQNHETPIMFFDGEHGSMKTTVLQAIKKIIDPSSSNVGSFPTDKNHLQVTISNKYTIAYDNVTGFDHTVSDLLCRAVTGDELTRKANYTDNELFLKSYSKKRMILNGISPTIEFSDFNDRTIYYKTKNLPKQEKKTKSEVWKQFDELLPLLLHQIFKIISKTLSSHQTIGAVIQPETRMADFEIWGETISQNLGHVANAFLEEYRNLQAITSVKDNDSYPIIKVIEGFMLEKDVHRDLTGTFYQEITKLAVTEFEINPDVKRYNWPKKPNSMTQQINKLLASFREIGYEIEIGPYLRRDIPEYHNKSVITITKNSEKTKGEKQPQPSPPPLPTENQAQIDDNFGKDCDLKETDDPNHNKTSQPEIKNSRHANDCGCDGKDGGDDIDCSLDSTDESLFVYWACPICHQDNPELLELGKSDRDGKSMEEHKRAGHEIKQFTKAEASEFL